MDRPLITRVKSRFEFLLSNSLDNYFSSNPVHVFHHIPKCGGISLTYALRKWFWVVKDYPIDNRQKIDLKSLRSVHCLAGHFHMDNWYLHERYPEILADNKFKIFTFLREPLEMRISLYHYEARTGKKHTLSLEDDLLTRTNFMAERFPCNESNYKEILDRYFFIGILERNEESMELLAKNLGRNHVYMPKYNITKRKQNHFSEDFIEEFQQRNSLDYKVYHYALQKFESKLNAIHKY